MNKKELEKLIGHKRHKYGAIKQDCNLGHSHPSRSEAMHCWALQTQMKANLIMYLKYEPTFELKVNKICICVHKPDFSYLRVIGVSGPTCKQVLLFNGAYVVSCVDEVKGVKTPDWKLKSKLFQALYPDIEYRVL